MGISPYPTLAASASYSDSIHTFLEFRIQRR